MIGTIVITIGRAVPLILTTPGHHHHLCSGGAVEVSRLSESVDLEFFNALNRSCHNARSHSAGLAAGNAGKVLNIANSIAGHVIGVVAAINGERVLIHVGTSDVTSGCHAW